MNRKLLLIGLLAAGAFAGTGALAQESGETERVRIEAERARAEAARAEAEAARAEAETVAQLAQAEAAAEQAARTEAELERARRQLQEARAELEQAARVIAVRTAPVAADRGAIVLAGGGAGLRARLGAVVTDARDGALVTQVLPGGNAAEAGLEVGDVIRSVNGVALIGEEGNPYQRLNEQLDGIEPGATLALVVERGGETVELDVATTAGLVSVFPDRSSREFDLRDEIADLRQVLVSSVPTRQSQRQSLRPNIEIVRTLGIASSPWGEMELVEMTEGLGRYFDTSDGLLVIRAPEGEAIGIEDGDVILSISGRTPNSPAHAIRILGSFEPEETIEFELMREGRRETMEYVVPETAAANLPVRVPED